MTKDRRREWWRGRFGAEVRRAEVWEYGGHGGLGEGCVGVGSAAFFKAEADEFASAWDGGPVDEFVGG